MKKWWIIPVVLVAMFCMAASLTTRTSSYQTLHTIADIDTPDTDLAAATGYAVGAPSGAVDLIVKRGAGYDTYANTVSIIVSATAGANGDIVTQKLYGIADGGPPQLIASIVWTIGTARVDGSTATYLWADDATITSSHITTITEADGGGSDRVCSVTLDVSGYRYLYGLWTADTGDPDIVTALYRCY